MESRVKTSRRLEAQNAGRPNPIHTFPPGRPLPTSRLLASPPRRFPVRSTTAPPLPHTPSTSDSPRHHCAAPRRRPGDASRRLPVRSTSSSPSFVLSNPPPHRRLPIRSTLSPPCSSSSSPPPRRRLHLVTALFLPDTTLASDQAPPSFSAFGEFPPPSPSLY
jgi:hypothetical protein